jgi:hypothetical protein
MYPTWFIDLIFKLRKLQNDGLSLKELPSILRAEAQRLSREAVAKGHPSASWPLEPENDLSILRKYMDDPSPFWQALRSYAITSSPLPSPAITPKDPIYVTPQMFVELVGIVEALAQFYAGRGITIERAALQLSDRHGRDLPSFDIPVLHEVTGEQKKEKRE